MICVLVLPVVAQAQINDYTARELFRTGVGIVEDVSDARIRNWRDAQRHNRKVEDDERRSRNRRNENAIGAFFDFFQDQRDAREKAEKERLRYLERIQDRDMKAQREYEKWVREEQEDVREANIDALEEYNKVRIGRGEVPLTYDQFMAQSQQTVSSPRPPDVNRSVEAPRIVLRPAAPDQQWASMSSGAVPPAPRSRQQTPALESGDEKFTRNGQVFWRNNGRLFVQVTSGPNSSSWKMVE